MSSLGAERLASALPHTDLTGPEMASRHYEAEISNDTDLILPTVSSWDQFYAILPATKSPEEPRRAGGPTPKPHWEIRTHFTPEEVREHYVGVKADVLATNTEKRAYESPGRWYDFIDTRFDLSFTSTGEHVDWRGAFLFPVWVDGIIGEVTWMVDPEEAVYYKELEKSAERLTPLFVAPVELTAKLNECDEAWLSGNIEKRLAHFEDITRSAIGIAEVNGPGRHKIVANTKDELFDVWSQPQVGKVLELERLRTIVSTFYAFAHYRMLVDVGDRTVLRETATIYPVSPERKFIGEMSYSLEIGV
jgi:hypothetical protein